MPLDSIAIGTQSCWAHKGRRAAITFQCLNFGTFLRFLAINGSVNLLTAP
jgi:hypothetical protein